MLYLRLSILLAISLLCSCTYLEGPRWAMIGDTADKAYYIDRESVERISHSLYRYPVKVLPYQTDSPHDLRENLNSTKVLYLEMDCRRRKVRDLYSGTMGPGEKLLFKRQAINDNFRPIEADSMHEATYDYLCNSRSITAVHNH